MNALPDSSRHVGARRGRVALPRRGVRLEALTIGRVSVEEAGGEGSGEHRRALRLIGISFVALAGYVLIDAVITLASGSRKRVFAAPLLFARSSALASARACVLGL